MTLSAATAPPTAGEPDAVKTTLRLPAALHASLTRQAARNVRTLNQEMIAILTGVSDVLRTNG